MLSAHNEEVLITKATDWWSWAVLFYELLFEEPPFSSDSLVGTYAKIANYKGSLKFPNQNLEFKPACELISSIFVEVNERIGYEQIKNDKFFKSALWNFDNIRNFVSPYIPEISGDDDISNFDVSESPEISNVSKISKISKKEKKEKFIGVAGDQFNFIGFSFNPDLYEKSIINLKTNSIESLKNGENLETELIKSKENLEILQKSLDKLNDENKNLLKNKNELDVNLKEITFQLEQEKEITKDIYEKLDDQLKKEKINENKIKEYIEKISKYDNEIDRLQNLCRYLESEKTNIELTYSNTAFDSMTLKKSYGSVEKEMNKLKIKYETLQKNLDKVNSELLFEKTRNEQLIKFKIENEKRLSVNKELNVPAILNRSILQQSCDIDSDYVKKLQSEQKYLQVEILNLKEIIKQNTDNECNIKNDLRIVSNENKQLKNKLENIIQDIQNNEEYIELERKYKSYESYVNLYKKQVKDLTIRVESLTEQTFKLRNELDEEINLKKELQNTINIYKKNYTDELLISKQLKHNIEIIETNNNFELSNLKLQNEQINEKYNNIKLKLENADNQIIILNKQLKESNKKTKELVGEKLNETQKVDENILAVSKWKNLFQLEKLKKDQAIKKLDEMVQLMVNKGITTSNNTLNTNETKLIKKLQMELKNEKIKYEKLLSDKEFLINDYNNQIQKLNKKLLLIQDERDNLKIYANAKKFDAISNDKLSVNLIRYGSTRKSMPLSIDCDQNNNYDDQQTISSKNDNINIPRVISPTKIHCEGILSLIPFLKTKRGGRKLIWKKYYGVLTLNELLIFNDKYDKNNPSKAFQKIETKFIKTVSKITHCNLTKADSKDIPKIFMICYFDKDIANVAGIVKQMNDDIDDCQNFDQNDSSIKKFKGHALIINKVDNQPFCGACSSNLGENSQGDKLVFCYECKKCALKFHTYHIKNNDPVVSYCSHDSPSIEDNNSDIENSNFYMNMFLMAASVEDQSKWIYYFNRILKITKNVTYNTSTSTSEETNLNVDSIYNKQSKLKKKVTVRYLESVLSKSRLSQRLDSTVSKNS